MQVKKWLYWYALCIKPHKLVQFLTLRSRNTEVPLLDPFPQTFSCTSWPAVQSSAFEEDLDQQDLYLLPK